MLNVCDPAQVISGLIRLKDSMNLPNGITNSLDAKLNAALDSVNRGNDNAAVNQLNAFINEVNAQTGNKITEAQSQLLITDAQAIINALG